MATFEYTYVIVLEQPPDVNRALLASGIQHR